MKLYNTRGLHMTRRWAVLLVPVPSTLTAVQEYLPDWARDTRRITNELSTMMIPADVFSLIF